MMIELPAGTKLPAISLWQPWAELTLRGRKFETRHAAPRRNGIIGKRVAIHAGTRAIGRDLDGKPMTALFHAAVAEALADPNSISTMRRGSSLPLRFLWAPSSAVTSSQTRKGDRWYVLYRGWRIPILQLRRYRPTNSATSLQADGHGTS